MFSFFSSVLTSKASLFSNWKVSAADYFSRSNRRGSVVSEVDDVSAPELASVSAAWGRDVVSGVWLMANTSSVWKLGTAFTA